MAEHHITEADIDSILEVNRKAVELHSEVAGQNETIIEDLEGKDKALERIELKIDTIMADAKETRMTVKERLEIKIIELEKVIANISIAATETRTSVKEKLEAKIEEMEKNIFRLIAILTTIGVGTIIAAVRMYLMK
jgi:hypothetical protein